MGTERSDHRCRRPLAATGYLYKILDRICRAQEARNFRNPQSIDGIFPRYRESTRRCPATCLGLQHKALQRRKFRGRDFRISRIASKAILERLACRTACRCRPTQG